MTEKEMKTEVGSDDDDPLSNEEVEKSINVVVAGGDAKPSFFLSFFHASRVKKLLCLFFIVGSAAILYWGVLAPVYSLYFAAADTSLAGLEGGEVSMLAVGASWVWRDEKRKKTGFREYWSIRTHYDSYNVASSFTNENVCVHKSGSDDQKAFITGSEQCKIADTGTCATTWCVDDLCDSVWEYPRLAPDADGKCPDFLKDLEVKDDQFCALGGKQVCCYCGKEYKAKPPRPRPPPGPHEQKDKPKEEAKKSKCC